MRGGEEEMNEKELAIKKWLLHLLDQVYLDADAYKNFFIRILPKERKRVTGTYHSVERVIEVSNLLRPPEVIALSVIKLLAQHIVVVNQELFDTEESEVSICKELLTELINQGKISKKELGTMVDTGMLEDEMAVYGEIFTWSEKETEYLLCVVVRNSFSLKGELRKRGYKWLAARKAWIKTYSSLETAEKEKSSLWTLSSEIDIGFETPIQCLFHFDYFLAIKQPEVNGDQMEMLGYVYENYGITKKFVKRVPTCLFSNERERLAKLEIPFELVVPKERQVVY